MKFEVGKFYRTRGGRKAQIFIIQNYNILGAIFCGTMWHPREWYNCGAKNLDEGPDDLISEWREPIERKTTAWVCWMESPMIDNGRHLNRLGILDISHAKGGRCQTKVEICVRELPEEGEL